MERYELNNSFIAILNWKARELAQRCCEVRAPLLGGGGGDSVCKREVLSESVHVHVLRTRLHLGIPV